MTVHIHDIPTGELVDPKEMHPGDVYQVEGSRHQLVCINNGQLEGLRTLLLSSRQEDNAARLRGAMIDDDDESSDGDGMPEGLPEWQKTPMLTIDEKLINIIERWRDAAIADGWSGKPLVPNGDWHNKCELNRDGYRVFIYTDSLVGEDRTPVEVCLRLWGPTHENIVAPSVYNMKVIEARYDAIRQNVG